jgi:hypothetical protein
MKTRRDSFGASKRGTHVMKFGKLIYQPVKKMPIGLIKNKPGKFKTELKVFSSSSVFLPRLNSSSPRPRSDSHDSCGVYPGLSSVTGLTKVKTPGRISVNRLRFD